MKKIVLFAASILTAGAMMAQTIVSTEVEKRNVVLEEFTGYHCGWCPNGHQVANEICDQYDGHAWAINIHTGGFASGSGYTTTMGDQIASLWNISGYPCGSVNRTSIQGRGDWGGTAAQIRSEDSPVNLAGTATLSGRTYSIHLEVYFPANADESTALLNIAVLQNNVLGTQTNNDGSNAEYIEGSMYRHMHMFRTLLTGQWGVSIPATQGTFIDTVITYTVPADIDGLPINDPYDLEFVAFVTKNNHKTIYSGTKVNVITETPLLTKFNVENEDCSLDFQPYVTINNTSEYSFISFTFNYDGNEVTVNKTIASMHKDTIHLPIHSITVSGEAVQNCATTKNVSLYSCIRVDGQMYTVNGAAKSRTFAEFDIYTANGPFNGRVGIDCYGSEASISLLEQGNCSTLWTFGGWEDIDPGNPQTISQIPSARYYNMTFNPAAGLYVLRLNDDYGDGWAWTNNSTPSGFWLNNANGEIISWPQGYSNGEEFLKKDFFLNVTSNGDGSHQIDQTGIDGIANLRFSIYPNPTTDRLNIECGEVITRVEILDMTGRTVLSQNGNVNSISTQALAEGVYMLRVISNNGVSAQKFVKE